MGVPVYMGDKMSAAGWRLAGAAARTPRRGEEAAALAWACAQAPLVLVSAAVAAGIAAPLLRTALLALSPLVLSPLVLVVPDREGRVPLPDLAARLREQLGLQA